MKLTSLTIAIASCVLIAWLTATGPAWAIDPEDTRMLTDPAIGPDRIAFVYDGDIWVTDASATDPPRRLTAHPGVESSPRISPDGSRVAFTGNYDGNVDVYVVDADGGVPKRLTWHPLPDQVLGFTPDGDQVLFASARSVSTRRYTQFFTVDVEGGWPTRLPIPNGDEATYSEDGSRIAYTPLSEAFRQWKNYRGGRNSRIWIYDVEATEVVQIPQPEGRCNDHDAMFVGDILYFLSDRDGEFNLYRYDGESTEVEPVTSFEDFPILHASAGAGRIIFEQAGYLHIYDPESRGGPERLRIGVTSDLRETRPRYVEGTEFIRGADVSPSAKRAVFEYRGEILTLPASKGDLRAITATSGVHERSPAWSPDGRSIAYFSDVSGEYQLHVAPQNGRGEVETFPIDGTGFYSQTTWSPDGEKIAFLDNARAMNWIDLETGEITRVDSDEVYGPDLMPPNRFDWSPDSEWIAYSRINRTKIAQIFLYSLEEDETYPVSDGLADATTPAFDSSGNYLYFAVSIDAGPVRQWFAQSNSDDRSTNRLYLATLKADIPNPFAKESDEEEAETEDEDEDADDGDEESEDDEKDGDEGEEDSDDGDEDEEEQEGDEDEDEADDEDDGDEDDESDEDEAPSIEVDGLTDRIVVMPTGSGLYRNLQSPKADTLLYLTSSPGATGPPTLKSYDLKGRKDQTLASGITNYRVAAKAGKLMYLAGGPGGLASGIVGLGPFKVGDGKLDLDKLRIRIEPRAEWEQMYHEAWRINRDFFYAPNMHGVDWDAERKKYAEFLPDLATRSDLNRVIRMLLSELAVGHSYLFGGDQLYEPETVPVGLLGADFEIVEDRYRIAKIYRGSSWDGLRAPLVGPGIDVREGDFLIEVNGKTIDATENLFARFEDTVGKIVMLTVADNPEGNEPRTAEVVPTGSESTLRLRAWIARNLERVREATDGRVAYVHVPDTARGGFTEFRRYFFPQVDCEAIIVDERYNAGGQVADYVIDLLRRPPTARWDTRHGADLASPGGAIQGPKVMIIDETAGSGGDLLPWMFRKLELGPLVGRRTWGGLVGILGFPPLIDGGSVTAPDIAIYDDGQWVVENAGVPPDFEVEQWPAEVEAGGDPQLEKAIELVLKALEEGDTERDASSERPEDYPVRNR